MLIRQRRKKIRPELLLPTWLKARRCSENLRKKQKRVWEEIEEFLSSFSSRDAVQPQRKCVRGDTWNNGASKVVRDRHICKKEEPSMGFCALLCGSPFPHLRDPLDFSSPSGWPSVAADWQTFFFQRNQFLREEEIKEKTRKREERHTNWLMAADLCFEVIVFF